MNYPLISEYTEAILSAEDNFNELTNLRPVLDRDGLPIMSSGNFAVVYKMRDIKTGKYYAVKCFTRDQPGRREAYKQICTRLKNVCSPYFVKFTYLESELFIVSSQTAETEFPIVVMDWVDGLTLDKYIEKYQGNPFALYELCFNFRIMAKWLICQQFAHGDIKPDNILVKNDGSIILIDYDGMFVGVTENVNAREQGTPDYRNPFFNYEFGKHIDDYALALLSLSLKLISCTYHVQERYPTSGNGLLISREDVLNINNSNIFRYIRSILHYEPNLSFYYATFIKCLGGIHICESDFEIKSEADIESLLKSSHSRTIECDGVVYTNDGTGVIKILADKVTEAQDVYIKEGVIYIYEGCLNNTPKIKLHLPSSLRYFNPKSFNYRYCSLDWESPWFTFHEGFIYTKDKTEAIMQLWTNASLDSQTMILGSHLYSHLKFNGRWPSSLVKIRNGVFSFASLPYRLEIPDGVLSIGMNAFEWSSIKQVIVPKSIVRIGEECFTHCDSLESVFFHPDCKLQAIPRCTFGNDYSLTEVKLPKRLKNIGIYAFYSCNKLGKIEFPECLEKIDKAAFYCCGNGSSNKIELLFPPSLKSIEEEAFSENKSISKITFTSSVGKIGDSAFRQCTNLKTIEHKGIGYIGKEAFLNCSINFESLNNIELIEPGALTGNIISGLDNSRYSIFNDCLYSVETKQLIYSWSRDNIIELKEGVRGIDGSEFLHKPIVLVLPNSYLSENVSNASFVFVLVIPNHIATEKFGDKIILNNKVYVDPFGVVYSGDRKELILFNYNLTLKEYEIINGCEIIRKNAFNYRISGPNLKYEIRYFNQLTKLKLPNTLRVIEHGALNGCSEITSIHIPNSVARIGSFAFYCCHKLTEITLPSSLKSLGKWAFNSSVKIAIPNNEYLRYEGGCLLSNENELLWIPSRITKLTLPETIKFEGNECWTYSNCLVTKKGELIWIIPGITSFEFPKTVSIIGAGAFRRQPFIKELVIPEGVTMVKSFAFDCCHNFNHVYLPSTMKKIEDTSAFHGSCQIHIPKGMRSHFMKLFDKYFYSKIIEY